MFCLPQNPCPEDRAASWVTTEQFYAGLGVVQAMPGPLFNFSAYLGAIIAKNYDYVWISGVSLCWIGLFAPGILLIFGVLPYWAWFRKFQVYRRMLPGLNAAAVGLVVAALFKVPCHKHAHHTFHSTQPSLSLLVQACTDILFQTTCVNAIEFCMRRTSLLSTACVYRWSQMILDVWAISPFPKSSLCIGLFAFVAVDQLKLFEPAVVLGAGVLGIIAWGAKMD